MTTLVGHSRSEEARENRKREELHIVLAYLRSQLSKMKQTEQYSFVGVSWTDKENKREQRQSTL